jgi:glycosyltransferase involved in cell wall biosynthesis
VWPRLSIITPSFNQAQFLEATLRSVLDQGYPDLEYIVIDGGSTDGSVEIIQRYADRLAYWVSEPDRGQAHAINKGFERATGEVLTWLNSDDLLWPGALALAGEIFSRWPEIMWLSGIGTNLNAAGQVIEVRPPAGYFRSLIRAGWYHGRGLGFIRQEGTFWRRVLWERAGRRVDEARYWTMDYELWRAFAAHADLVSVASILGAYRYQPNQKTAAVDRYYREAGVGLPHYVRLAALPARLFFTLLAWPLAARVVYDHRAKQWRFHPGPFFRPGLTP